MKKNLSAFGFGLLALCFGLSAFGFIHAASEDSQIADALNQKQQEELLQQTKTLNEKITFTQINSCQSMESVMSDFLELYKKYYPQYDSYNWYAIDDMGFGVMPVMMAEASMGNSATKSIERDVNERQADAPMALAWGAVEGYSTTNLQKANVDEPEILKSNGNYLFYYSNKNYGSEGVISIIKTPQKSDLSDAEVVKRIKIPSSLSNVQLFLQANQLIILGNRYSYSDSILWNSRTVAIVYDISDMENLVLQKLVEVQGYYQDARIVNGEIYLISSVSLDRYDIAYNDKPFAVNEMLPTSTEISLKSSTKEVEAGKILNSYEKVKIWLPCSNIFYLLPSEETLKQQHILPNFTLISKLSLNNLEKKVDQKLIFGTVEEFHMSEEALYLPSPIYFSSPMRCVGCRWPTYNAGQNTLIHKFSIGSKVEYKDSLIVPGMPLSQYSMDEDAQGNFRILTKTRNPNLATHFFVFDKNFKLAGQLLNIEPGEEFKSSRYIGDKLYLVTFQQIDPLFVVDIADITKPKIVGELKIPGYSTYLHPYAPAKNNIQYLIGLGMEVEDNGYGGVRNDTMKVDLYKIDYNKKETAETKCSSLKKNSKEYTSCVASVNSDNIAVTLETSHTFTGGKATSPALNNPRMFVWNSAKNLLLLPVFSYTQDKNYNTTTTFAGLKGLNIQPTQEIKETISQNFPSLSDTYYRSFNSARVGYLGEVNYFLSDDFAAFIKGSVKVELGQ